MKRVITSIGSIAMVAMMAMSVSSCKKDKVEEVPETPSAFRPYHIVLGQGSTGESLTFSQGVTVEQMSDPAYTVNFNNYGFEIPSVRTARVYTSNDGRTLYNLNYGGGEVSKYSYNGGQNYTRLLTTQVQAAIGTANPRWTKIDDNSAMLHHVIVEHTFDNDSNYISSMTTVKLAQVNLSNMSLGSIRTFQIPSEADGGFIFRIDAPAVQNGKLIYGCGKQKWNASTNAAASFTGSDVMSIVVDYPSLQNEEIIRTSVGGVKGNTNGYRTPVAHKDEFGDVYQVSTSKGLSFLKISNGQYDEGYEFKLDAIAGHACQTNGWFYVGNGIGYVPVLNADAGAAATANWDVYRVDVYGKTAVKMNLGQSYWLQQYQWSSYINGKFFMALTPLGGEGHIYMFDPTSTSPDAFTKGAKLKTGTDAFYLGIF